VDNVPWFLPGVASSLVAGVILGPAIGRLLRAGTVVAAMLIVSLGTIASATLTPLYGVFETGVIPGQACDFARVGPAPLHQLLQVNDVSLNVLLFVPLGAAIALIPLSRRKVAILVVALVLPVAIETIQLLMPVLGRGCESADVFDNLTGLLAGLAVGSVGRWITGAIRAQRYPSSQRQMH
jgi:VanZ family protein